MSPNNILYIDENHEVLNFTLILRRNLMNNFMTNVKELGKLDFLKCFNLTCPASFLT